MEFNIEEVFNIVKEPEHSREVLLKFQEKYGYDSVQLYRWYKQGLINLKELDISKREFDSWIHHFLVYKESGGDLWELNTENNFSEEGGFR